MTEKLDLVCQHGFEGSRRFHSRTGNEPGRQRIERSEVIQSGQVLAARQVGGEKQTKQVSETTERAAMRPEGGYVAMSI
jgi:hypothetical protein